MENPLSAPDSAAPAVPPTEQPPAASVVSEQPPAPAAVVSQPSVVIQSATVSSDPAGSAAPGKPKLSKAVRWGVRLGSLIVFLILFLLPVLPGTTSYLKSEIGNTGTASTPASCTTLKTARSGKKGFPLTYALTIKTDATWQCYSSGQGSGQSSVTISISPSDASLAKIGLAVDAVLAIVLAFVVSIVVNKVMKKKVPENQ